MHKIVVAIDGLSGCGKSVTAAGVAKALGYRHFDSGAMYRAVTLYCLERGVSLDDAAQVAHTLANISMRFESLGGQTMLYLNGRNVGQTIRTAKVSAKVSQVSAIEAVRKTLTAMQSQLGEDGGAVMDGRDIGVTVFPQAELKVFMTASLHARGLRRQLELQERGELAALDEVMNALKQRDEYDSRRAISPLRRAADAVELDTTHLAIDEQIDAVARLAALKIATSV